jgi:hypothetical protein
MINPVEGKREYSNFESEGQTPNAERRTLNAEHRMQNAPLPF